MINNIIIILFVAILTFLLGYFLASWRQKTQRNSIAKQLQDVKGALDETAIVAITNVKGEILEVNDKFCEISKYTREELIGQDHRILNSAYHEKDFFKYMWSTIAKGKMWHGEVKNKAKDGSYYWVDTNIVPLLGSDGKPFKYVAIRFDITSRKEIEQLLRISAAENENLSKNLQDITQALDETAIVAITNEKGIIEKVNDKFCEISKYSREELLGQDHRILNSGHHEKDFFKNMWATIGNGQIWQAEVKNRAKDGSHYWVDTHVVPLIGFKNKPVKYVAIRFDVTSRKDTEDKLVLSAAKNVNLAKNLQDITFALDETAIVVITNEKGIIEKVNDKFCELSKYAPMELIGQDHRILNSGYHEKGFFKNMWATIGKGYMWKAEVKNRAKDGSYYWVDTHIVPLLNEHGKPFKYVAIRFDITSRKEAEERLRQSVGMNEDLTKSLSDITHALDETAIVAITNEKGIIEKVNDKFCEISKYSREELLGQDHRILNSGHHEKDFFKNMWATIGNGQIWRAEVKNRAKDGSFYWVDTHVVPLINKKGKPFKYVAIRFDITNKKKVDDDLFDALNDVEKYTKIFSHDLKTPLRGISTLTDFIIDDLEDTVDPEILENLRLIKTRTAAINGLVDGLVHFSQVNKIEATKEINTFEILNDLSGKFKAQIHVQENLPNIKTSFYKFQQIVGRLIDNAINFNDKSEPIIEIKFHERDHDYLFSVWDNGPGIEEVYHKKVFELFQTLEERNESSAKGTGLTITKKLVNQLGGDIWIESDGKKGSQFFFTIPKRG